jgi:hypothetical protein
MFMEHKHNEQYDMFSLILPLNFLSSEMTTKISLLCQNHKTYRISIMDTKCALNFSLHVVSVVHLFGIMPVASIHNFLVYLLSFSV